MKALTAIAAILWATTSLAQDGQRASDTALDPHGLADLISGQALEFYDGSKSTYQASGRYGYTYTDDGPVWTGTYRMGDQSDVCVDFDSGSSRCDTIVMDGPRVVLITSDGLRFPVRNMTVAKP